MNQEQSKQPEKESEIFKEEAKKLIAEEKLVRLIKNGQEFYFDSHDLDKNLDNFLELRRNGWKIAETFGLPAYRPSRQAHIKEMGLTHHDWGYGKIKK
jgi:hypothetical protein